MFAIDYDYHSPEAPERIDPTVLESALSRLSDDELERLEDDLDFCNFAGVPSRRVLEVLQKVVDLDAGWKRLLEMNALLTVPEAY